MNVSRQLRRKQEREAKKAYEGINPDNHAHAITRDQIAQLMKEERLKGAHDALALTEMALKRAFGFGPKRMERLIMEVVKIGEEEMAKPADERVISGIVKFDAVPVNDEEEVQDGNLVDTAV